MDKRYLVYEKETGICVNVIIWDGNSEHSIGENFNCEVIPAGSQAWIGWKRISKGNWEPPIENLEEKEQKLRDLAENLPLGMEIPIPLEKIDIKNLPPTE